MKKILNFAEKFNNETMFFLVKHDMHESRDERRDGKKYLNFFTSPIIENIFKM